jgi:IS30 family transposase
MRKPYKKLTYADRQIIERMSEQGEKPKAIAEKTGTHIATIYRELQRGTDTEGHYKAEIAQQALFC